MERGPRGLGLPCKVKQQVHDRQIRQLPELLLQLGESRAASSCCPPQGWRDKEYQVLYVAEGSVQSTHSGVMAAKLESALLLTTCRTLVSCLTFSFLTWE